ncbi:MAG: hypothetical protein PHR98_03240 [Candidatus Shapirobacteria bacterium]|jgi:hypothetical protein|nr:hypothetical protein [Candidatus Shapirobacteria bacterium]
MNKKEALKILIQHSFLLSKEVKEKLLLKIEIMSEYQVDSLGKFLALEKSKAIESFDETKKQYEEIIAELTQ